VNVSAKDKATGKEQQIRIQASGGLNDADIEKMVKDAESHAEEDKKRRAAIEAKNQAEALIHSAEKQLKDNGDKVAPADKTAVETAIAALKEVKDGDDVAAIEAKTNDLTQAVMKVGEALYRAAQDSSGGAAGGDASGGADAGGSQSGGAGDSQAGGSDEKVVDADFEEVDDRKGKTA
jgi:molecular chaperone DnaK